MRTATALLLALLALAPLAPSPAAAADVKIGYVDLQRALNEVEEGKSARANLKKEFDAKQKLLDDKKAELEKLRADFEKQASVMSEDARKTKGAELEKKFQDMQGFFMGQQRELSDREREVTRGIFEKMQGLVREIADAEGFSMVLQGEALVYAVPSLDLTNELVRKYNARYKAGAAAAPAAAAPAKKGDAKADGGAAKPAPKKEGN